MKLSFNEAVADFAGPGELQISLDTVNYNMIRLLRPSQVDMNIVFAENLVSHQDLPLVQQSLPRIASQPSYRTYQFNRLQGTPSLLLHILFPDI